MHCFIISYSYVLDMQILKKYKPNFTLLKIKSPLRKNLALQQSYQPSIRECFLVKLSKNSSSSSTEKIKKSKICIDG